MSLPLTLIDAALQRVAASPREHAFTVRDGDEWTTIDWRRVGQQARAVAAALIGRGVQPGDRVAIIARTRLEWVLGMMGIHQAGGVVTTVYPSCTDAEVVFILRDAGCVLALVEDEPHAARLQRLQELLPELRGFFSMEEAQSAPSFRSLLREGRTAFARDPTALQRARAAVGPDDLAALVYTSGTTGDPKGVMLSHLNLVAVCTALQDYLPLEPDDLQLLFLPMSHVFGMVVALCAIHVGAPTALEPDHLRLPRSLREVRPTFMPAVPRVFEKIHATARATAEAGGARRLAVFDWSDDVARRYSKAICSGQRVRPALAAQHALADALVYRHIREGVGGRIRAFSSGAAPLSRDLAHFFHGIGMVVLEGYGLTETAAITTCNPLEDFRLGTVGITAPGLDLRIAHDGEILVRGPSVMQGYYNHPEETAQALRDGWLHTGDVGSFDEHGHLRITGRIKHIIITAGGKNIAPAPIEAALVGGSSLLELAVLHGDRQRHLVALLVLDPDALRRFADQRGLAGTYPALSRHPAVREAVQRDVDTVNAGLASFSTVKNFHLMDHVPTVQSGEMTPSTKPRRDVLLDNHRTSLAALYLP